MGQYHFKTVWKIRAPREAVWREIRRSEAWPEWWPGVERVVEMEKGDPSGVGSITEQSWRSVLPYSLHFWAYVTDVVEYRKISAEATGELRGNGTWLLEAGPDGVTTVTYLWNVSTSRLWMRVLEPLLRPLFRWNHDRVMQWGAKGLASRLQAELLAC